MGHSRRFGRRQVMPGLPLTADLQRDAGLRRYGP
jgi:hypothetical protein